MVGISGVRTRQMDLIKRGDYEIVVFGSWSSWEKYFEKYISMEIKDKDGNITQLRPELQWTWRQNYPELVVEDIAHFYDPEWFKTLDDARDWLYADLLYRGVNKWLAVRYFLIRYKKLVMKEWNNAYQEMKKYEKIWQNYNRGVDWKKLAYVPTQAEVEGAYKYGYWKGYYEAMREVRGDLKTLCMTPRYTIWNGERPGIIADKKISRGWLRLIKTLYEINFGGR